jgi:BirA family transcriptional regulator, biotin operon repressor / biotin---[acetyl-CoA-carboxylase] ligase
MLITAARDWDTQALQQPLQRVWPGLVVQVLDEVDSTNTQLLHSPAGTPPTLLVALHQTQGRGRMGRAWHSEGPSSLTFSIALALAPARWDGLSLAVGLALAEALDPGPPTQTPRLMLKWPNDLWLLPAAAAASGPLLQPAPPCPAPARKLGGVLIETAARGAQRWCVVGVGLNLRPACGWSAPPTAPLSQGHASLCELHPDLDALTTLATVALPLAQALHRFEQQGFAPLQAAYARRDALRGLAVGVSVQPPLLGQAEGVDAQGALLVRHPGGLTAVNSGEVSVRLQTPTDLSALPTAALPGAWVTAAPVHPPASPAPRWPATADQGGL